MSSKGVPIQDISDTVGHKSTHVTETVYPHVIGPAIRGGATVMDNIFDGNDAQTAWAVIVTWIVTENRTDARKTSGADRKIPQPGRGSGRRLSLGLVMRRRG